MANAPISLDLPADGAAEDLFDPFRLEIRTAYHNAAFEVLRRFHKPFPN
jgi:hypothetical protein